MPLPAATAAPPADTRRAALALLLRAARPDAAGVQIALLWLIVAGGLEALGPVLGKALIDQHLLPHAGTLAEMAALLAGAWVSGCAASVIRYFQLVRLSGVAMRSVQRIRVSV